MADSLLNQIASQQLADIRAKGLYKTERRLLSPQQAEIQVTQGRVLNLCANNYLGLANHPRIIEAASHGLQTHGYGMASVRFICGTQQIHKDLEYAISAFLRTEDTILYGSCFDANGGLFEVLLDDQDAVISDTLNHASVIDGIRLCKAKRLRFAPSDMQDLETKLNEARTCRLRLIATDGVFSMDGDLAKLDRIVQLAERYEAAVMAGRREGSRQGMPTLWICFANALAPTCFPMRCLPRLRRAPCRRSPWLKRVKNCARGCARMPRSFGRASAISDFA